MGTIFDVFRGTTHDYVDSPFWSLMQIRVKLLDRQNESAIMDEDLGKVLLVASLTMDQNQRDETKRELVQLKRLSEKYSDQQFRVYSHFCFDVQGGEDLTNQQIARELFNMDFLKPTNLPHTNKDIKFIEKIDVNGQNMHNLYKFLKRNSPLFVPRYGQASRIQEHYSKFLCNRYGEVKHFYSPQVEYAVIEADIKGLLEEEFLETKFKKLLEPPDAFF